MPSVEENLKLWTEHPWPEAGAEWTIGYGGPDIAWDTAILPRLVTFLPAKHILELGPGFGLWTRYLREHARRMTLIDLAPRCIAECQKRFGRRRMSYHVNDGQSLAMVADGAIDLVFSWHSLVHAEHEVMRAYISQLARKLRPGGVGLIQHSNLGTYRAADTGRLTVPNDCGFGENMTAALCAQDCSASGLQVLYQEITPWAGENLISCFSLFRRPLNSEEATSPTEPYVNRDFWEHVRDRGRVRQFYRYPRGEFVIR